VAGSRVKGVWLAQSVPRCNAEPLPLRVKPSAVFMAEFQLAQKQSKADNDAPTLKPFTAMKRAKREPNGLKVCVGFVH